jgi:hypothetical protein
MLLINKLENSKNYKKSSINTYKSILKAIKLEDCTEKNLKGNIIDLCDRIEESKFKNAGVYYNIVLLLYKLCDYNEDEMTYLKDKCLKAIKKADNIRKNEKLNYDENRFEYNLSDVQKVRNKLREKAVLTKDKNDYIDLLISALYSDDKFGPKRAIDIMNLKWDNFDYKNRILKFTTIKNNFDYESKPLSDEIFNPLELLYHLRSKHQPYIILTKKNEKFERQNFGKRFKQIFEELPKLNFQNIRTLWASSSYKKSNGDIKAVVNHAYELNHNMSSHFSSYLSPIN